MDVLHCTNQYGGINIALLFLPSMPIWMKSESRELGGKHLYTALASFAQDLRMVYCRGHFLRSLDTSKLTLFHRVCLLLCFLIRLPYLLNSSTLTYIPSTTAKLEHSSNSLSSLLLNRFL